MRINYIDRNVSSNGLFSKIGQMISKSQRAALAKKAEDRLQSRLLSYENNIMRDFGTDLYLDMKTGNKFTGKFVVKGEELEHLYHVKDGKLKGELVRLQNGENSWAIIYGKSKHGYDKAFPTKFNEHEDIAQCVAMCDADKLAEERIADNFVLKQLMSLGKDSIYLSK